MGFLSNATAWRDAWAKIDLAEIGISAVEPSEQEVLELNKKQLKEEGRRPDGSFLKPYAPSTVRIKQIEGKEWRWRTLEDTGNFLRAFNLYISGDMFDSDSSDPKTAEILEREGNVFGWTSENQRVMWNEIIRPYTIQAIKDITGAQ